MGSPQEGVRAQLRNIEQTSGIKIDAWLALIGACGLTKHTDIVAMLKREHGLAHGAAHRLSLIARERSNDPVAPPSALGTDGLYTGKRAFLVPIHERVFEVIGSLGDDIEQAPKKGYISFRRRKQFAMIKPGAREVNVGLILGDVPAAERLESAATFNALFTHRVRLRTLDDVDEQLTHWLRSAYARAA